MVDDHDDADEGHPWVYLGTRTVDSSGRINIPATNFDVDENDAVDVVVEKEDGTEFYVTDARVDARGRVTVPAHQRRLHDVDEGDIVTVQFSPTGKHFNGGAEPEETEAG